MDWIARKRDWRQFHRLSRKLLEIQGSAYYAKMVGDPEVAARMRDLPTSRNPPLFRWDDKMSRLTDLADISLKKGSSDPDRVPGLPRPITGDAILARQERNTKLDSIRAKATPGR